MAVTKILARRGGLAQAIAYGKMTSQRLLTWRHSNNAQRKRWAD